MTTSQRTVAILVAAGRGLRAGAGGPKQYREIGGRTVIHRALAAFAEHPEVAVVQPVVNPDDIDVFNAAVSGLPHEAPAHGGATRQASVLAGLEALVPHRPDIVLIHDAARPFVTSAVISRAIVAANKTGAAIPVVPVTDTIKEVSGGGDITATPDRAKLRIAQTPQTFKFETILEAHRRAARDGLTEFTDDAAIAEWAGLTVATFEGDVANMKLTTPEDFVREEARLAAQLGDIRTGTGYDVHAFGEGDHVWLCGLRVPHTKGFLAHSDGDVGLHALVDAILGALADGDIGSHFPPSDMKWKGRLLRPVPQIRYRARHRPRRPHRQSRSDDDLRAPEDRPVARPDARPYRRNLRRRHLAHRRQSHHQRTPRLHRPRGRHRGNRERDDPAAVGSVAGRLD
ncbi:2-C-methyl-D-erythritol 4-phosphate cytidylyltransferase/2-C-methyl-D-erythritol 2,4-cyclodiphosphate synthase [Bradyrhizobium sp. USDA 4353]